jgi:hypothetical protein
MKHTLSHLLQLSPGPPTVRLPSSNPENHALKIYVQHIMILAIDTEYFLRSIPVLVEFSTQISPEHGTLKLTNSEASEPDDRNASRTRCRSTPPTDPVYHHPYSPPSVLMEYDCWQLFMCFSWLLLSSWDDGSEG